MSAKATLLGMLATPGLRLRLVAGDRESLAKPIRWVHSTELLDPGPYLRGGELICTVGVALTDAATAAGFVHSVAAAEAVGICFGYGDVHDRTPRALVTACADTGLPLMELPAGAPFLALSEYLADQWVRAGSATTARGERTVARMLEALSRGASVADLLEAAGEATAGHLELRPGSPSRLRWTGPDDPPSADLLAQLGRLVDVARHERDVIRRSRLAEVGHLLSLMGDEVADARAVRPALAAAGLGEQALLTVRAWPSDRADDVTSSITAPALLGLVASTLLAVTAATDVVTDATGPCGTSSAVAEDDLGLGVREARAALDRAVSTHGRLVGPNDLTTLDALLDETPDEVVARFVDQLLRPLLAADRRHGMSQLQTLRVFLDNNGSLQRTARQQFLHVNTVRHRLARVHEITGRDPFSLSDLIAFAVALRAEDRARAAHPR